MSRLIAAVAVAASLALAACGDDNGDTTDKTSTAPATQDESGKPDGGASEDKANARSGSKDGGHGAEIKVADSQYGPVLFNGSDRAIYLFDKEASSRPACYGACAEAWPPVLTKGEPVAGDGASSKLLGTTERNDGSTQVTYDGHPLYFYVNDPVGKVGCHNVDEFGGLWLAVESSGEAAS